MILAVVQVALLFFAGQLALAAAQDGLRSGRYYGAESVTAAAQRDAQEFLSRTAGTTLTDVIVTATVDEGVGLLRVRVEGSALSLIPGTPVQVSREAVGGLERVASRPDRNLRMARTGRLDHH
jgi:hypothetical protein